MFNFLMSRSPTQQHRIPWVLEGVCTLEDAYSGIVITGSPGSGKTAAAARHVRRNLCALGGGGIVMCAKPGEFSDLQGDCELTGRTDDLVEFVPGGAESCDILDAELTSPGGTIASAAALLDLAAEMDGRMKGSGGGDGDGKYWSDMNSKGFRHAIAACWLVRGKCSLVDVNNILSTAPTSPDKIADPEWRETSFCWQVMSEGLETLADNHEFVLAAKFWISEWSQLAEKTRSICISVATNLMDRLMAGPMKDMIASGITTHGPASTLQGKILAINMPVLRWQEQGVLFANIMKTLVQRAALRRDTRDNPRPVFIFADEAQFFMIPQQDMMVSTVARESRLIQVHIFQNLPMLYAALGSHKSRDEVDGWLSCHHTKVVLANTCVTTGEYFSKLFGMSWQDVWSETVTTQGGAPYSFTADIYGQQPQPSASTSRHPQLLPDVPPYAFGQLHRPSQREPWADAFVFQAGQCWPETGKAWTRVRLPFLAAGPKPKPAVRALEYAPRRMIRGAPPLQLEGPRG